MPTARIVENPWKTIQIATQGGTHNGNGKPTMKGRTARGHPLDIGLPRMSSWEVARQLRDMAGPAKQPIIVAVTGYGQDDDHVRSSQAGCDLHLVKPVEPGVLIGYLERFRKAL